MKPYLVTWTNPVTGTVARNRFYTPEEARAYIAGRVLKYGGHAGFVKPAVRKVAERL